jgi:exopolysaccharide biosynthesis polyprenyl glycosylphosphotransferase
MFLKELHKQKVLFASIDALALVLAAWCALTIHDPSDAMRHRLEGNAAELTLVSLAVLACCILIFRWLDLYRMRGGSMAELLAVCRANFFGTLLAITVAFLLHLDLSRITTLLVYPLSVVSVLMFRAMLRWSIRHLYASRDVCVPLVIVGLNRVGRYICDQVLDEISHYEVLGFLEDNCDSASYRGLPVLGATRGLRQLAAENPSLEAVIALPEAGADRQSEMVALCEELRIRWSIVPWLFGSMASGLRLDMIGAIPLVGPRGSNIEGLNYVLKRGLDLCVATVLLVLLSPVMAVAAAAIAITSGMPILYRQTRVGMHGRTFNMLKFRTMRPQAGDGVHREFVRQWITAGKDAERRNGNGKGNGKPVFKLSDDDRITPIGRWLRRFSLDELPQLINVIRGEMSLIGPRPALPYEVEQYEPRHHRRLEVLPGVTGLWQVSGRNHLSFEDMVRLDVQYLENWSLANDLKILALTMPELVRGGGL